MSSALLASLLGSIFLIFELLRFRVGKGKIRHALTLCNIRLEIISTFEPIAISVFQNKYATYRTDSENGKSEKSTYSRWWLNSAQCEYPHRFTVLLIAYKHMFPRIFTNFTRNNYCPIVTIIAPSCSGRLFAHFQYVCTRILYYIHNIFFSFVLLSASSRLFPRNRLSYSESGQSFWAFLKKKLNIGYNFRLGLIDFYSYMERRICQYTGINKDYRNKLEKMGYHDIRRRVVSMRTQRGRNVQKARSWQLTLQHQTWTGEPRLQPCTYHSDSFFVD